MTKTKRIVFDVESVGLHGEGFAVGWVVLDAEGNEVSCGIAIAEADRAESKLVADREWVEANVLPALDADADLAGTEAGSHVSLFKYPYGVRETFWAMYQALKAEGPVELWADCPWPVEARFLNECVEADIGNRNWQGPYPLLDVGVMMRASGVDAMATHPRLPNELPVHNPLADARQSARLLLEAETRLAQ